MGKPTAKCTGLVTRKPGRRAGAGEQKKKDRLGQLVSRPWLENVQHDHGASRSTVLAPAKPVRTGEPKMDHGRGRFLEKRAIVAPVYLNSGFLRSSAIIRSSGSSGGERRTDDDTPSISITGKHKVGSPPSQYWEEKIVSGEAQSIFKILNNDAVCDSDSRNLVPASPLVPSLRMQMTSIFLSTARSSATPNHEHVTKHSAQTKRSGHHRGRHSSTFLNHAQKYVLQQRLLAFKRAGRRPKLADYRGIARDIDGLQGGRSIEPKSVRHWFWRPSLPPASYAPSKHTIKLATNHGHSACRRDSSASDSLRTWDQAEHGTCATKGRDDDEMRGSEPRNEMRGPRRPTKRSKAPLSKPPTPHQPRPQAPYLSSRAQALMERSPFAPRHMERHVERAEFYNRSQRERLMEHLRAENLCYKHQRAKPKTRVEYERIAQEVDRLDGGRTANWRSVQNWFLNARKRMPKIDPLPASGECPAKSQRQKTLRRNETSTGEVKPWKCREREDGSVGEVRVGSVSQDPSDNAVKDVGDRAFGNEGVLLATTDAPDGENENPVRGVCMDEHTFDIAHKQEMPFASIFFQDRKDHQDFLLEDAVQMFLSDDMDSTETLSPYVGCDLH